MSTKHLPMNLANNDMYGFALSACAFEVGFGWIGMGVVFSNTVFGTARALTMLFGRGLFDSGKTLAGWVGAMDVALESTSLDDDDSAASAFLDDSCSSYSPFFSLG